jgi:hypothetical protein
MQSFLQKFDRSNSTLDTFHRDANRIEVAEWDKFIINTPSDDFDRRGFRNVTSSHKTSEQSSEGKLELPLLINGWQFLGAKQNISTSSEELVLVKYQEAREPGTDEPDTVSATHFLKSNFYLDASVPSGPETIPYNSTVWYNGTKIALQAPFLDLGFESW